jgi:hypothetical protein
LLRNGQRCGLAKDAQRQMTNLRQRLASLMGWEVRARSGQNRLAAGV